MEGDLLYGQPGLVLAEFERPRQRLLTAAPPALFTYRVTPNPIPYTTEPEHPSVVTLMLIVINSSDADQECTRLQFKLPGEGDGALTTKPGAIRVSAAKGTNWTISSNSPGTLTATPRSSGRAVFKRGASIAFILENVE